MRTDEEVIAQIESLKETDFFGFIRVDLIATLSFEKARQFLAEGADATKWVPESRETDAVISRIRDYMPFAWDKANGCRGLSAARSLNHMKAWLWLLGEEEAAEEIDNYSLYGKPQLAAICEKYGIDWKSMDNGHWCNDSDAPHTGISVATLSWK